MTFSSVNWWIEQGKQYVDFLKNKADKKPMTDLPKLAGIPRTRPSSGSKRERLHLSKTQELLNQEMKLKPSLLSGNVMWASSYCRIRSPQGSRESRWPGVGRTQLVCSGWGLRTGCRLVKHLSSPCEGKVKIPLDSSPWCEFMEPRVDYDVY